MSNSLSLDDIPDIMSSSLSIIQDEINRITALPVKDRKPADIKIVLSCIDTLSSVMKVKQAEEKQATMTINMLSPAEVMRLAAKSPAQQMQGASSAPRQLTATAEFHE